MPACDNRLAILRGSCVPQTQRGKKLRGAEKDKKKKESQRAEDMIPGNSHCCLTHI